MKASIDYLLANAGPVIQYRLRKEILHALSPEEECTLLAQMEALPHLQLLRTYVKPNGYIGRGMHSWDNWRGEGLRKTLVGIREGMDENGILRMDFHAKYNRRYSPKALIDPGPYSDEKLEDGRDERTLNCDLTFWAVALCHLMKNA